MTHIVFVNADKLRLGVFILPCQQLYINVDTTNQNCFI